MFKDRLLSIKKDCKLYHTDKKTLMYKYVNERLSESLKNYYKEIQSANSYVGDKSNRYVIKKYKEGL